MPYDIVDTVLGVDSSKDLFNRMYFKLSQNLLNGAVEEVIKGNKDGERYSDLVQALRDSGMDQEKINNYINSLVAAANRANKGAADVDALAEDISRRSYSLSQVSASPASSGTVTLANDPSTGGTAALPVTSDTVTPSFADSNDSVGQNNPLSTKKTISAAPSISENEQASSSEIESQESDTALNAALAKATVANDQFLSEVDIEKYENNLKLDSATSAPSKKSGVTTNIPSFKLPSTNNDDRNLFAREQPNGKFGDLIAKLSEVDERLPNVVAGDDTNVSTLLAGHADEVDNTDESGFTVAKTEDKKESQNTTTSHTDSGAEFDLEKRKTAKRRNAKAPKVAVDTKTQNPASVRNEKNKASILETAQRGAKDGSLDIDVGRLASVYGNTNLDKRSVSKEGVGNSWQNIDIQGLPAIAGLNSAYDVTSSLFDRFGDLTKVGPYRDNYKFKPQGMIHLINVEEERIASHEAQDMFVEKEEAAIAEELYGNSHATKLHLKNSLEAIDSQREKLISVAKLFLNQVRPDEFNALLDLESSDIEEYKKKLAEMFLPIYAHGLSKEEFSEMTDMIAYEDIVDGYYGEDFHVLRYKFDSDWDESMAKLKSQYPKLKDAKSALKNRSNKVSDEVKVAAHSKELVGSAKKEKAVSKTLDLNSCFKAIAKHNELHETVRNIFDDLRKFASENNCDSLDHFDDDQLAKLYYFSLIKNRVLPRLEERDFDASSTLLFQELVALQYVSDDIKHLITQCDADSDPVLSKNLSALANFMVTNAKASGHQKFAQKHSAIDYNWHIDSCSVASFDNHTSLEKLAMDTAPSKATKKRELAERSRDVASSISTKTKVSANHEAQENI